MAFLIFVIFLPFFCYISVIFLPYFCQAANLLPDSTVETINHSSLFHLHSFIWPFLLLLLVYSFIDLSMYSLPDWKLEAYNNLRNFKVSKTANMDKCYQNKCTQISRLAFNWWESIYVHIYPYMVQNERRENVIACDT